MNRARGLPGDIVGWLGERDRIYNQIMKKGWSEERQAFVQHYGSDVLDASILLMPLVLFIAPTDPRWLSTLDAIGDELVSDSLVYRYNIAGLARRAARRRGHVLDLLVLVRRGAHARRRARGGAAGVREDAHLRQPPRPLLGGDRADRRAARQLPAGVHPPRADQRRVQPGSRARVEQAGKTSTMRVIECNECGETVSAANDEELAPQPGPHLRESTTRSPTRRRSATSSTKQAYDATD